MSPRPRTVHAIAVLLVLAGGAPAAAGSLFDPAHRYRTITTEHFILYFHQGEDALATRLATVAEDVWRQLASDLAVTPPPRTHLVLADETEAANGWATPLPYDTVMVTATRPGGSEFIGNTNDWLRLVLTHEFTHIVQLDQSVGWARALRKLFGRTPLAFPNLFLPQWQIEGLATYEEGARTGDGRPHAGDFRAIETEAARAGLVMPLDRVNGGLSAWPAGLAPYAYGLGFHAYLARRYGESTIAAFARATAGRLPYTTSSVFRRIYGRSLGDLWRDYQDHLATDAPVSDRTSAVRVTHHGFTVLGPRFLRSTCDTCPPEIVYSLRGPHAFPSLNTTTLDGGHTRRIATRYLGSTAAVGRRTIYFDQVERRRNVGLYSDLYALDRTSGRVSRLTLEARLLDPDLSPDERTLVAVRSGPARRDLVLLPLRPDGTVETTIVLASTPETQFAAPRWSPDGRTIAAERQRLGAQSEIVTIDVASGTVRVIGAAPEIRFVTPTWRPDGAAIVAAAASSDHPFNLVELDPRKAPGAQADCRLTHLTGGALWPDVSPDARRIVFAGQTAEGFDVFEMPYRPAACTPRPPSTPRPGPSSDRAAGPLPPSAAYSPWPTLRPTSWSPIVVGDSQALRLGAATAGADVLGYHSLSASATWLVSRPDGVPRPDTGAPDWAVVYGYSRWRPTLWAAATTDTSFHRATVSGRPVTTRRESQVAAGIVLPISHVRTTHTALASVVRVTDTDTRPDGIESHERVALRAAWAFNSSHVFGYSITPERGIAAGTTLELVRRGFGASADATSATADARVYLPALSTHDQFALRLAAGVTTGEATMGRLFNLGGAAPNLLVTDFGTDALSLLRGFPVGAFAGTHVALLNTEYRFPLSRPERGTGTLPLFLHTVHAALFADAGHAWSTAFDRRHIKAAAGAELSANLVAGYSFPLTVTLGVAWARDGSGLAAGGGSVYARLGRAF